MQKRSGSLRIASIHGVPVFIHWSVLIIGILLCAITAHAAAPDESLTGCWRSVRIVQYAPDSKLEDTSGRCTLQYKENQIESSCATSAGAAITTYQYRVVRPGVYSATMASSTFKTGLIGSVREYEYQVDGDRLVLITYPQTTLPAPTSGAVRVESESRKVPCQ